MPILYNDAYKTEEPVDYWSRTVRDIGKRVFQRPQDADIFERQMRHESGGYNELILYGNRRGEAGELGGPQYTPAFAKDRRVTPGVNPYKDFLDAATVMKSYMDEYQDWSKALSAYNAGKYATDTAISRGADKWMDYIPASTRRRYIPGILSQSY